jgi:hypothetical protein
MADVEFIDNRVVVNRALEDAVGKFLLEASAEIVSAAATNSRVDEGQLKGSWKANVEETKGIATVGSELENAIWEEFGTGEYAAKGNGRKGGWYVPGEKLSNKAKGRLKKITLKNGKELYFTKGKKPNRTLQKAYDKNKSKIINRARQIFKEGLG